MKRIPIYSVLETENGREHTRYCFKGDAPDSTYGYSYDGERISAIVERGYPVLAGYFTPDPDVVAEVTESTFGDILLFCDGVGYTATEVVRGVPACNGKGHYRRVAENDPAERGDAWMDDVLFQADAEGREAQFLGLTWPELLQVLANANDPAWPTFATRKDNEAATNAAWEALQRWQEGKK